ncbi:MAG: hypothetical protein V1776_05075 [Candidatus Diapherotrites archaeon]
MSFIRFFGLAMILLSFSSLVSAWPAYVPETYQSNQLYAGSFYQPSGMNQGWTYYAYYPNSGYPVLGGGRYYPPGYLSGSYGVYPSYSMYGNYGNYGYYYPQTAPVHTTLDFYYHSNGFGFYCTTSFC